MRLEQQQRVKAFMSPVLVDLVSDTIKALDIRKEQGVKPERVWFVERRKLVLPVLPNGWFLMSMLLILFLNIRST
ncbi:hypothetical protein QNM99_18780 [Pseudomonas sp. PCH446]